MDIFFLGVRRQGLWVSGFWGFSRGLLRLQVF